MITEINIKNFKSIVDLTIPLSNINVFIGENGCGKTNILEAVGFASAVAESRLKSAVLETKGIRNAKPSLIFNSFLEKDASSVVEVIFKFLKNDQKLKFEISADPKENVFPEWRFKISDVDISEKRFPEKVSDMPESVSSGNERTVQATDIKDYLIFTPHTLALRGMSNESKVEPLGLYGEYLDVLISTFTDEELKALRENSKFISWLEEFVLDQNDELKFQGYKQGRGQSKLYFKDKYMMSQNNIFSAENANEGVLHVLFYIALMISEKTPKIFGIDNIENGLNPKLCRNLMKKVAELAIEKNKQALITTHNPAVLDGLNLHDDHQRLFVVKRNDEGHTKIERIKLKPDTNGEQLKLSEMWMRGYLGGLPTNF